MGKDLKTSIKSDKGMENMREMIRDEKAGTRVREASERRKRLGRGNI